MDKATLNRSLRLQFEGVMGEIHYYQSLTGDYSRELVRLYEQKEYLLQRIHDTDSPPEKQAVA